MTLNPILFLALILVWLAGVGWYARYLWRKVREGKALGKFENGLGTTITRESEPLKYQLVLAIYWFGFAMAVVMLVGGTAVMMTGILGQ